MKIIVDEMPEAPSDCLFGESDSWCETYCKIDNCPCDVIECRYLKAIGEKDNETIQNPEQT